MQYPISSWEMAATILAIKYKYIVVIVEEKENCKRELKWF